MFLLHENRQILLKYRLCHFSVHKLQYHPSTHRIIPIYHSEFALFPFPDTFSSLSQIFPKVYCTWSYVPPQTYLASPGFSLFAVPSQLSQVVKDNLWSQMAWVWILSPPLSNCVIWGKLVGFLKGKIKCINGVIIYVFFCAQAKSLYF